MKPHIWFNGTYWCCWSHRPAVFKKMLCSVGSTPAEAWAAFISWRAKCLDMEYRGF